MTRVWKTIISIWIAVFCWTQKEALAIEPICSGIPAILTSWNCSEGGATRCYLWGVDKGGKGRWDDDSRFVIEYDTGIARSVDFAEACIGGRCDHPEMAICTFPVRTPNPSKLELLLR